MFTLAKKTTTENNVAEVLNNGKLFYYHHHHYSIFKVPRNKYGICSLLKRKDILIQLFDELDVKVLKPNDTEYTFYSDLSLIIGNENSYNSGIKFISGQTMTKLIFHLGKRDWSSHSNDIPFMSLEAFLHYLVSFSINATMITAIMSDCIIDWSYIDDKGNSFIHATCLLESNDILAKDIINKVLDKLPNLINHYNQQDQTPLALLLSKNNPNIQLIDFLIEKGASLFTDKNDYNIIPGQFIISLQDDKSDNMGEVVIAYEIVKGAIKNLYTSTYLIFSSSSGKHTITQKIQEDSENLKQCFLQRFDALIKTNCPQIIDYVFDSKNKLLSEPDRESLLHLTVRTATPPLLRHILKYVKRWDVVDNSNYNFLHTAINCKKFDNLNVLLNTIPTYRLKILMNTPNDGNMVPFNMMLNEPISYESISIALGKECVDVKGNNFIHIAIEKGKFECLRYLVANADKKCVLLENISGVTPLQLAITKSCIDSVKLLLECSIELLDHENRLGCNYLHSSIIHYNFTIFKMVLAEVLKFDKDHTENKLINRNTRYTQEEQSYSNYPTPFLLSIQHNKFDATELLVTEGVDIEKSDNHRKNVFHYLLEYCKTQDYLTRVLNLRINKRNYIGLQQTAKIQDVEIEQNSILFFFSQNGDFDSFKRCFQALSLNNIFRVNTEGDTILQTVLNINNVFIGYLFLQLSQLSKTYAKDVMDFINSANHQGETALSQAVRNLLHSYVKEILDLGADIHTIYRNNNTILHIAINTNDSEMISILLNCPEINTLLCKKNDSGELPMIQLIKSGKGSVTTNIKEIKGGKLLHYAVQINDISIQNSLFGQIKIKSEMKVKAKDGKTPFHYAIIFQNIHAIRTLIKHDVDILVPDDDGKTSIHLAIDVKNEGIWTLIFQNLSTRKNKVEIIDIRCFSQINLFQYSILQNFLPAVRDILTLKPNLFPSHPQNNTIIHLAAETPELTSILLHLLQEINTDDLNNLLQSTNEGQLRPLHHAIICNNTQALKIFETCDKGKHNFQIAVPFKGKLTFFSPKFQNKLLLGKYFPSHPNASKEAKFLFGYRVESPNEKLLILTDIPELKTTKIFQPSSIQEVRKVDEAELKLLLKVASVDVIIYAIRINIIDISSRFSNGATILHLAAKFGSCQVLNYFLTYKGSDAHHNVLTLNRERNSIVYYALQNIIDEVFQLICEHVFDFCKREKKFNFFDIPNSNGKRLLGICLEMDKLAPFEILSKKFKVELMYKDEDGSTLLHKIIQSQFCDKFISPFLESLEERYDLAKIREYLGCVTKGCNALHLIALNNKISLLSILMDKFKNYFLVLVNSQTNKNRLTPLHLTSRNEDIKMTRILLENGAKPNIIDCEGKTPLHYAASSKNQTDELIVMLLNSLSSLLTVKDNRGRTPVFYAVTENNVIALEALMTRDRDLLDTDNDGKTIIHFSIEMKEKKIWEILFSKLKASITRGNLPVSHLFNLLQYSMIGNNSIAFTDLLSLTSQIEITDTHFIKLIATLISSNSQSSFLVTLIAHVNKFPNYIDRFFCPKSLNNFEPPLQLAIRNSNSLAIRVLLGENIPLAFPIEGGQTSLYSQNNPETLIMGQYIKKSTDFLIGYKIRSDSSYLLVTLPDFTNTNIYSSREVLELKKLTKNSIIKLLQCNSIEPINSQMDKIKMTPNIEIIYLAAEHGSILVLKYLLSNPDNIKFVLKQILFYAILNKNKESFKMVCNFLVNKKAFDVFSATNDENKRIIEVCLERDDYILFCFLLKSEFKVELSFIDAKGYTLFHKLVLLKRDLKFLEEFHEAFPHDSKKRFIDYPAGQSKLTALHLAILENQPNLVNFMLRENYDVNAKTNCGNSPLHLAILYNSLDITKSILETVSNKVLFNEQNKNGFTPLHIAIQNANIEIIALLLGKRTIRLDLYDILGRSVLHHAVLIQEIDLSTQILSFFLRKSNLFQIEDKQGQTVLHYSVIHDNLDALNLLLENCDCNILFIRDKSKNTIFHYSIEIKTVSIWKAIFENLKHCKKSTSIIDVNSFKTSLLVYSIEQNNLTAFQDILSLNPNLNATAKEGNTLLHLAALSPETQHILNSLLHYLSEHQHEKAQDITCSQNNDNLAPFHLAILHNNIPAIDIFLRYDVPLVFYDKLSSQYTICSKDSPLKLHLCRNNSNLLIGYKVIDQVSSNKIIYWILTEIPKLNPKALKYRSREIYELTTISEHHVQTILKYPSPEPILTFLHTKLIPETLQFTNNCNILHLAAKFGSIEVVSELSKSMQFEELDQNMETVLFYALENGDITILQFLLTKISENTSKTSSIINNENASGKRIIEVAIDMNYFEAFECLLKRDFQVELTYRNKNGLTLLHKIIQDKKETSFFQALLEEIKARNPEFLNEYINSPKHSSKETALHLCLRHKQREMLNILLNLNPNFSCEDENKDTPLHYAIKLNIYVDLILNSIKKLEGDNLSLINAVNNKKLTPLHLAIINHDQPSAELLLNKRANLYAIDTGKKSMLHYAVEIEYNIFCQSVIKFLFQFEQDHPSLDNDLLHMQDNAGSTALHMTVKKSKTSTTKLLIQQNPNLMLKDDEGKTVLHHSVCNDNPDIVDLLMDYIVKTDTQAINIQDSQGNTPLHLAISLDRQYSLPKLLAMNPALDLKNELGLTLLHLAVVQSEEVFDQVLKAIEDKVQSSRSDISHYLQALNNEQLPPLHHAIMCATNIELVKKLKEKGAKLNYEDGTGIISLFAGKGGLDLEIVKVKRNMLMKRIRSSNHFVGFKMNKIPYWILTELPTMDVILIEKVEINYETVNTPLNYTDTFMINLIKCECIEPIKMAIEKKLVNDREKEKGGNRLLNFASKNGGSAVVINFIKSTSLTLEVMCSWIESSVSNLESLKIIFESIPDYHYDSIIKDSSELSGEDLKRNKIAIALSNALLSCLKNKSIEIFTFLLSKNLCLNMQYGNGRDTLLHSMIRQGESEDFITLFLDKVKEYENDRNKKLLIDGEPLIDAQNSDSQTALALCILKNQEQNFNALLKYDPSLTLKDKSNNNILHHISKTGNMVIAAIVFKISKLECLFNAKNSEGCIPLHIAIDHGNKKIAEMLLEQRSDFYSQDDASRTVLHHALLIQDHTTSTQSSMIKFILDYEKNNYPPLPSKMVGLADKEGFIPLSYAIIHKSLPAVKHLVPYAFTLKHRDKEGQTALHIASLQDNSDIFQKIIDQISIQEQSIEGESWLGDRVLCYQDKQGRTALHLCIEYKSINALRSLLKKRPCLNLVDNEGNSLLHHAVANKKDCQSILTIILAELKNRFSEYESYFYLTNNQGLPVLQYAIQKDNLIAVEFLVKEGIKLAFKQQSGEITFCHKRSSLELLIFNNKSKTSELYAGFPIKTQFVVAKLDNLELSKPSLEKSEIQQLNNATSLKKRYSKSIFRCDSSEPFGAISNLLELSDEIGNDSLIEFAGKYSSVEVINCFLDCFKIDVFQRCKITILESAILHNPDKRTIKEILERLPLIDNLRIPEQNVPDLNRNQLISLCLYNSLQCSIKRKDTEIFEELLKFGAKLDNPYGDNAGTILHLLTDKNSDNFVESLLKWLTILKSENKEVFVGRIPFIDALNNLGETALLLFTSKQLESHIECLLKYSPKLSQTDSEGNNALHLAALTDNFKILKLLVAYAIESNSKSLLDEKNSNGLTPIFIAIDMLNLDITEHLISSGSSLSLIDKSKRNVLHHIAMLKSSFKRSEFITLLEREKVLSNLSRTQDIDGKTPLHLATINQFKDTIENLLKADPFTLTLIDTNKRTALHYAAMGRDENIVKLLIDTIQHEEESPHGLDWLEDRVMCRQDFEHKTPLHCSIENQNSQILNLLLKTKPCLDLTDKSKNSLLHYAVSKSRNVKYVDLLLKELAERLPKSMPAYLYAENVDGIPPLQYAILNNNQEGAEKLIEYEANLAYETTHEGYTLWHGKKGLTIEFVQKQSKDFEYYVGLKIERNCYVVCLLPELKITAILKPSKFEVVKAFSEPFLFSILKSRSIEPFMAALNSKCEYFNINSKFEDGRHLKHFIAQYASSQVTDYFLTLFHEPVYDHEEGNKSMIEFAVRNKTDPATLQLLLKKAKACDISNQEERKNCIESCISKSFESSLRDNDTPNAFQDLLGFVSRIDYRYAQNNTLLHLTIEKEKNPEFIRTLFTKVKDLGNPLIEDVPFIDVQNSHMKTALYTCIELEEKENLETLLTYSPDLTKQDNFIRMNVLHLAVHKDLFEFVEILLKNSAAQGIINSQNCMGLTPLHFAAKNGNINMTKILLDHKANYLTTDDVDRNILHHAVAIGDPSKREAIVKFILSHKVGIQSHLESDATKEVAQDLSIMATKKDNKGYTPLHLSVILQSFDAVKLLLDFDPQLLFQKDLIWYTPLHLSIIPREYIMDKSDPFFPTTNSIFHSEIFDQIYEKINSLGKHGDSISCNKENIICCQDRKQRTAMHYAIQYKRVQAFTKLLETGSCLYIQDDEGNSLLHEAVMDPDDVICLDLLLAELDKRYKGAHLECFKF